MFQLGFRLNVHVGYVQLIFLLWVLYKCWPVVITPLSFHKPPWVLFVKMTFWGLFSKFDLLISSPVPSQGVSQYLIIDKYYMYFGFVYF